MSMLFTTLLVVWVFLGLSSDESLARNYNRLELVSEFYGRDVKKGVIFGLGSWMLAEAFRIEVFMNYLVALHIYLLYRNMTTFELICYERELAEQRAAQALWGNSGLVRA